MSITIQNLRIIPYGQKDTLKPVFGDTMHLTFRLADAPQEGDRYLLGLDYERILFPTMRPLCAMATEYTAAGADISFELGINTERFAVWASRLKKPTPIWLQLQRERGGVYTTLLLDDVLALPSVVDGANMVFPGTPLEDKLAKKLDKPTEEGQTGNVLKLGEDGNPFWGEGGGGGSAQQATDAEIDARESKTHAITPNNLNYAVTAALTDANKIQRTDAQKASAQDTLGVGAAPIIGTTAPTTSTVGIVGQLYVDSTTSKTYHCTAVTNTGTEAEPVWSYTWVDDVNAKGGVMTSNPATITVQPSRGIFAGDYLSCSMIESIGCGGSLAGYVAKSLLAVDSSKQRANKSIIWGLGHSTPDDYYHANLLLGGKYTVEPAASSGLAVFIGGGASTSDRRNIEELSWSGDLYIAGGNQQGITVIPSATTAYTLVEGVQSHTPSAASTYTLPAVPMRIIADGRYFTRNPLTDGTGYYGWLSGTTNRYTASATPSVGDNTYTNTALTSGAKAITAIDERTHECILTIRFSSSVLTYAFEDSSGNPVTPLPLAGTIADGSVVAFRCTWEALLGQWVIMPVMLGTYAEVTP